MTGVERAVRLTPEKDEMYIWQSTWEKKNIIEVLLPLDLCVIPHIAVHSKAKLFFFPFRIEQEMVKTVAKFFTFAIFVPLGDPPFNSLPIDTTNSSK